MLVSDIAEFMKPYSAHTHTEAQGLEIRPHTHVCYRKIDNHMGGGGGGGWGWWLGGGRVAKSRSGWPSAVVVAECTTIR